MKYEQQAIIFRPDRVRDAISRAQAALLVGRYQTAETLLRPFATKLPAQFAGQVLEILATCALAGVGRDWPGLVRQARVAYQIAGDSAGSARVQERAAEAWLARGELNVAQKALEQAMEGFVIAGQPRGQASVSLKQVRLALLRGQLAAALRQSQRVVQAYAHLRDGAGEALARLVRAQVLAAMQRASEAAPDLLWAERLAGPDATPLTRVHLGLARAKVLIDLGYHRRAAAGLLRLEHAVHTLAVLPCSADFARCLGLALRRDDPETAHRNLMRARMLHEQLGQTYCMAECDLGLAVVDARRGLPLGNRLDVLRGYNMAAWPLLMTEYQTVRAQRAWSVPPRTTMPTAVQVSVAEPGLVQRIQTAFRRVWGSPTAAEQAAANVATQLDLAGTEWGPFGQMVPKKKAAQKRKASAEQDEDQGVNYTPSIRSTSLDLRV